MMKVTRIGVDLAKHIFQVHGIDDHDKVVVRKPLTRGTMRAFFARFPPVWLGWTPVPVPTPGRVSWGNWAIRCA
jgi:transposase